MYIEREDSPCFLYQSIAWYGLHSKRFHPKKKSWQMSWISAPVSTFGGGMSHNLTLLVLEASVGTLKKNQRCRV
jgi:hypothetical protein